MFAIDKPFKFIFVALPVKHLTTLPQMRRPLYMIALLVFYSKERMYDYEGLNYSTIIDLL